MNNEHDLNSHRFLLSLLLQLLKNVFLYCGNVYNQCNLWLRNWSHTSTVKLLFFTLFVTLECRFPYFWEANFFFWEANFFPTQNSVHCVDSLHLPVLNDKWLLLACIVDIWTASQPVVTVSTDSEQVMSFTFVHSCQMSPFLVSAIT